MTIIAIDQIGFRGELKGIETSNKETWHLEGNAATFVGDFITWYIELANKTKSYQEPRKTIDRYVSRNEIVMKKLIPLLTDRERPSIVSVSRNFSLQCDYVCGETDAIIKHISDNCQLFERVGKNLVIFLEKYPFPKFVDDMKTAVCRKFYIGHIPTQFWENICQYYGKNLDDILRELDPVGLRIRDHKICHKPPKKIRTGLLIDDLLVDRDRRYAKSTFAGKNTTLETGNSEYHYCTFTGIHIHILSIKDDDKIVFRYTSEKGISVRFRECTFHRCAFSSIAAAKAYFYGCTFVDCTIPVNIGTIHASVFYGKNVTDRIWEIIIGVYKVNNTEIEYNKGKMEFKIRMYSHRLEYADPGNMIADGCTISFVRQYHNSELTKAYLGERFMDAARRAARIMMVKH